MVDNVFWGAFSRGNKLMAMSFTLDIYTKT